MQCKNMQFKTFSISAHAVKKEWVLIDATNLVIGRLAAHVADILRGKNKVTYTPHIDCGDNVIIINADKAKFTGNKHKDKVYYRHTGFVGGLKETTPKALEMRGFYKRTLTMAIDRMMGNNGPLSRKRMKNLYIYAGAEHKHIAQQPRLEDFAAMNRKNSVN